jgi:beta-lactam-binding protein with PASTA domain
VITSTHSIFKKETITIEVPHLERLSLNDVSDLLHNTGINIIEFEDYYNHLKTMEVFNQLIDLSGDTLKK